MQLIDTLWFKNSVRNAESSLLRLYQKPSIYYNDGKFFVTGGDGI